jgi:hypothetical protein
MRLPRSGPCTTVRRSGRKLAAPRPTQDGLGRDVERLGDLASAEEPLVHSGRSHPNATTRRSAIKCSVRMHK